MPDCDAAAADRGPDQDVSYALLRHPVRRSTLEALADETPPVQLSRLASVVADGGTGPSRADAVATLLHHAHLPKLDDAGLVDYEPRTNTVESWHIERLSRPESGD